MLKELLQRVKRCFKQRIEETDKPEITCVVDALGWVQESRIKYLSRYIDEYELLTLTAKQFASLWNRGKLPSRRVYFASWRIPYALVRSRLCEFLDSDFHHFMASVTSHYNIGGGIDPSKALATGTEPQEAFDSAIASIKQFKVVTANSRILYNLLYPHLDQMIYAPNGVDTSFFSPAAKRIYDPKHMRVGWVGKVKAAKNYELVEEAFNRLGSEGFIAEVLAFTKDVRKGKFLTKPQMKKFYQKIDYYLCTSWHEGTPNPALEAAACGVPIITTRVGNMPDLIEDGKNGFFIDPDINSLLERFRKIRRLNPAQYSDLSRNIRDSILKDWTWEKNVDNYKTAFKRLLDRREESWQSDRCK